ncbi:MAG TPA: hypothetical protein P5084_04755 [Paludibacter sp.]|nr:hypothetical protein [Paludibacter sp.]
MIHPVKINDNTPNGKRIIEELRSNTHDVEFVNFSANSPVREGFMTGEEIRKNVKAKIQKHYQENGLI